MRPTSKEGRAGDGPIVALVAHGQRAGDQGHDVQPAHLADGGPQRRPEHIPDPFQVGPHPIVVGAVSEPVA